MFFEKRPPSRLSDIVQPGRPIDYQLKVVGWIAGFYKSSYSQGFFFKFHSKRRHLYVYFPICMHVLLLYAVSISQKLWGHSPPKNGGLSLMYVEKKTRGSYVFMHFYSILKVILMDRVVVFVPR